MLSDTVFRSEDLPVADRFDVWQELMSRTYAPMRLSSEHVADFQAHQRLIRLGEVTVWPATSDDCGLFGSGPGAGETVGVGAGLDGSRA